MHVVNTSFVMLSVKVLLVSSRDNLTAFPFVFPQVHLIQVTLSIYIDSKWPSAAWNIIWVWLLFNQIQFLLLETNYQILASFNLFLEAERT